jgi:two-component system, LytTR family, sensor kinase
MTGPPARRAPTRGYSNPSAASAGEGNVKISMKRIVHGLQSSPKAATSQSGQPKDAEIRYPGFGTMFLMWTVIGVLTTVRNYFVFPSQPEMWGLSAMLLCAACYYPWIALTPVVFRIEKRFPLGTGRWARNLSLLAMFSVPFCLLASPLMLGSFTAAVSALRDPRWMSRRGYSWLREFPVAEAIFWCSVAGGYFIRTLFQLREQEQKAARLALEKSQLEAGLNQAQLEVLRARLNPHFLFNSLQNISVMTKQDPQTASRMLTRLGDLLRAVLRHDSRPESTLQEEIELTRAYVSLEQMRFGDRLNVGFEIAQEVQQAMVPCFLLQPLIENAVIHGLRGARKTGIINVSAVSQGGELVLVVTDNGIGPPAEDPAEMKIGIGLRSTCERLARMYPNCHTFSIRKPAEGGTEVRITIPLRFADYEDRSSHDEQIAVADR